MRVCRNCKGFVPDLINQCPNCEATVELKTKGPWSKILYGITASSVAMTLMACYGRPPCNTEKCQEQRKEESKVRLLLILIADQQLQTNSASNANKSSNSNIQESPEDSNNDARL